MNPGRMRRLSFYPSRIQIIILFGLLLITPTALSAQAKKDSFNAHVCLVPEYARQLDTGVFLIAPTLTYAPETRFALGFYSLYYFRLAKKGSCTHPSKIEFSPAYTLNKQILAEPVAEFFSRDDNYVYRSRLLYQKYPEKFYGIGNQTPNELEESYSFQMIRVLLQAQKRLTGRIFAGLQYQGQYIYDIKPDTSKRKGELARKTVRGYDGGFASGPGLIFSYDSRDVIINPTKGFYSELSSYYFDKLFGSKFDFGQYVFDVRKYWTTYSTHVFALQAFLQHTTGAPPFRMMALLGGDKLMRGYYAGRYRDNDLLVLQGEYRLPLYWRIGMTVFGGFGQVADKPRNMTWPGFHTSYGVGLRYLYDRQQRINVRADVGFGERGVIGEYITVGEAF